MNRMQNCSIIYYRCMISGREPLFDYSLMLLTFQGKLDNVEAKMEKVQKELSKTDEMILNGEKKLSAIEELLSKEDNSKEQEVGDISKFRRS